MWDQRELRMLSYMVGAVNCFSYDEDDEIQVFREDGSAQGVLKTWAAPFIAFLDIGNLDKLAIAWPKIVRSAAEGNSFDHALSTLPKELAEEIVQTIDNWNNHCRLNPDYFRKSLYRVLNNSYQLDTALLHYYQKEVLSTDPKAQLIQQLTRFKTAVGLLGPFYHLEALIANEGSRWSLLEPQDEGLGGGELDALVFLLPAIFACGEDIEEAKDLYLSCVARAEEILAKVNTLSTLLLKITKTFGFGPADILFAAELLNKIPVRVGGKREDFDFAQAVLRANDLLESMGSFNTAVKVARDINAEIRFCNWLLVVGLNNLYKPIYESICGPAKEIERILQEHPEFWHSNFRDHIVSQIFPQLKGLDAESAKGRLLYSLIVEDRLLSQEFYPLKLDGIEISDIELSSEIVKLGHETTSRRVFGDKAANLGVLSCTQPLKNSLVNGFVLPSTAVDHLFFSEVSIREQIVKITGQNCTLEERLRIGRSLIQLLQELDLRRLQRRLRNFLTQNSFGEVSLWAVRSSCFGEDDPENPSAGIYKSILQVEPGDLAKSALTTVCSWFSEIAITHRYLVDQSDLPLIAVLFQPYMEGEGGVVEIRTNFETINVHVGNTASAVTGGEINSEARLRVDELIGDKMETKVASIAFQLYEIFGALDLEWVYADGVVKILQLKTYKQGRKAVKAVECWVDYDVSEFPTLEEFQSGDIVLGLKLKGNVNLEAFQGELFGHIARLGPRIGAIAFERPIPKACHFANICSAYGIELKLVNEI